MTTESTSTRWQGTAWQLSTYCLNKNLASALDSKATPAYILH